MDLKRNNDEKQRRLYEGIGRFAVEFERTCEYMRECVVHCQTKAGLPLANARMARVLVADLGAEQLRKLVGATFVELRPSGADDRKAVADVLKHVQKLIKKRNGILHASWRMRSPAGEFSDPHARGRKVKASQTAGLRIVEMTHDATAWDELIDEATGASARVAGLLNAIINESDVSEAVTQVLAIWDTMPELLD